MTPTSLSYADFSAQLSEIWDAALVKEQIRTHHAKDPDDFRNKCYQLYLNSFHGKLPFMVIGDELLKTKNERYNFGVLAIDKPLYPLLVAGPPTEMNTGAILSEKDWCVTLNDCYILGSVHARKSFHLYEVLGRLEKGSFWDEIAKRPRVLGRELMMLKQAGYLKANHHYKSLERAFFPQSATESVRLSDLVHAAEKTQSFVEIQAFLSPKLNDVMGL